MEPITNNTVLKWKLIILIDTFIFSNFKIAGIDANKLVEEIDKLADSILALGEPEDNDFEMIRETKDYKTEVKGEWEYK